MPEKTITIFTTREVPRWISKVLQAKAARKSLTTSGTETV